MSDIQGKPVFGICECKEKVQVLSVDQATDLIQQMAANGFQVPTDYIPKTSVNGIIEQNNKDEIKFWRGTKAKYDALTEEEKAIYTPILTDDPKYQEIETVLNQHNQSIENLDARLTKLGFKQGSVNFTSPEGTPAFTATLNSLQRQGNYVIGKITLEISSGSMLNAEFYTYGNAYAFDLPEEFRVKDGATITISGRSGTGDTHTSVILSNNITRWLGTYPNMVEEKYGPDRFFVLAYTNSKDTFSVTLNFGYEAEPID